MTPEDLRRNRVQIINTDKCEACDRPTAKAAQMYYDTGGTCDLVIACEHCIRYAALLFDQLKASQ